MRHNGKPNRLISEKSPYLLQHAYNPVDWFPWGEDAFEKAKTEERPIFLSIGYATCHWCHVMERESFEDDEIAGLLNDVFVCVKVDREERPDIDSAYMAVCQMMNGSGGWPLTILMTPEGKPFFAGTYFPRESLIGRIGMRELIGKMKELWSSSREKVLQAAEEIVKSLSSREAHEDEEKESGPAGGEEVEMLFRDLLRIFDEKHGGFGRAPKFPMAHTLLFLLSYGDRARGGRAFDMADRTLDAMAKGGIFDHLGGGFHRYSTDQGWLLPHFEKMLYDQALLAMAYLEGWLRLGKEQYALTARKVIDYVLRDLAGPDGGFCCAEDADSEGEEGRFYLWRLQDVEAILDDRERGLFADFYGLTADGNYEDEATRQKTGANILHRKEPLEAAAGRQGISLPEATALLRRAEGKLLTARSKRERPLRDDKILTDWNGLMIAALAMAARILGDNLYREKAEEAARFVLSRLRGADGRVFHRYRDGEAAIKGFLDDHAFLAWGLIELYEATNDDRYLRDAVSLTEEMKRLFWDDGKGGYFFTAAMDEAILVRKKECHDGAAPSGNSVALYNLFRLHGITGDRHFREMAIGMATCFRSRPREAPTAYSFFLHALLQKDRMAAVE